MFDYDGVGNRLSVKVKKGQNGTADYVAAWDFGVGMGAHQINLVSKEWIFPTATTTKTSGVDTGFTYTFGTGNRIDKLVRALPPISTAQNGPGGAPTEEEYYDVAGRLRYFKDAEGFVTYYSYDPDFGSLAYVARDINPSSLPTSATGNASRWITPTTDISTGNKPTRAATPTPIAVTRAIEYDAQGRVDRQLPEGSTPGTSGEDLTHYFVYESNAVLRFPYWDEAADESELPIEVTKLDDAGQVTQRYAVQASRKTVTSGKPTGINGTTTQAHYVSWSTIEYNSSGAVVNEKRYHNIPSSGSGTLGEDSTDNYYETLYEYDSRGRLSLVRQFVAGSDYQSTENTYDALDRLTETQRVVGTVTASPSAKIATIQYDDNGVGDGYVTQRRTYRDATNYTGQDLKYDFRGNLRGIRPTSGSTAVKPFTVSDVNWQGQRTAVAFFDVEPTWTTVVTDDDYAATTTSNRRTLNETLYDDRGRAYKSKVHLVNESTGASTGHRLTNRYYDDRDLLIGTEEANSAGREYAYDGLGRRYQTRVVDGIKLTASVFTYRTPVPKPLYTDFDGGGGNDKLMEVVHHEYDGASNVIKTHSLELNHNDTNGLSFSANDYVRRSVYRWYDDADRLIGVADHGSGDTGSGLWKYVSTIPSRGSTVPTTTDTRLVTQYSYHSTTERLEKTTAPDGVVSLVDTDDLGRAVYSVSNYVNFSVTTEANTGGGSFNDEDQVIKREYNGLDNVIVLTAMDQDGDGSGPDEETKYYFDDNYSAELTTKVVYPRDATDDVIMTYARDGRLLTRTDQRGSVITYGYNNWRGLASENVTTLASGVDGYIRYIARTYDGLRRLDKVTSKSTSTGSVRNEVQFEYLHGSNRVTKLSQDHNGTVGGSSPSVQATYADDVDGSNIFTNGLRLEQVTYPSGKVVKSIYDSGFDDALHRVSELQGNHRTGTNESLTTYDYNGVGRHVETIYTQPSTDLTSRYDASSDGTYEELDLFGRVLGKIWKYSTTVRDQFDYTYDRAGNRLTRDIPSSLYSTNDLDQVYGYDDLQRLVDFDQGTLSGTSISSPTDEKQWLYDALGNWETVLERVSGTATLIQTRAHNKANETGVIGAIIGTNWRDPVHDANGNMTTVPKPSSLASGYGVKYDAWNRIVYFDSGYTSTYRYDGLHRRISKNVYATGKTEHFFYNHRWQCLEVRDGSETGSSTEQYVWHPYYIDALAVRYYDGDGNGNYQGTNETHYALQDANFNVTALANTSGTVFERYAYSSYGTLSVLDANFASDADGKSDVDNPFTFTGRRLDAETGIYQYRFRYYHAQLGRFVSRDPIGYEGSEWNLYEYVASTPANFQDPFGETKGGKRNIRPTEIPANWTVAQVEEYLRKLIAEGADPKRTLEIKGWLKVLKRLKKFHGIVNRVGRKVNVAGCVGTCTYAFNDCMDEAQQDLERMFDVAGNFSDVPSAEHHIELAYYIWKLDAVACSVEFTACALRCLCPF